MGRNTAVIPKASVVRMLMEKGAERVSEPAAKALSEVAAKIGTDIAVKAIQLSKHTGRKTVTDADIKLAAAK